MPLFHMEHCVIAALLSEGKDHRTCGRPCERHQVSLRDRAGMDHPVEADVGCRNTVFHARPQSAAHARAAARGERGVRRFRIELVREKAADVRAPRRAPTGALVDGRAGAGRGVARAPHRGRLRRGARLAARRPLKGHATRRMRAISSPVCTMRRTRCPRAAR